MDKKLHTLDPKGAEILDSTPMELPVGVKRPPSLAEMVARLTSQHMREFNQATGTESFEEAEDFDIPDDPIDPTTPYEENFDQGIHVAAREAELRSGTVEDISQERKEKARKTFDKYSKRASKKTKGKEASDAPAEAASDSESDDTADEA